jgi:uncharacterized membrane protein YeaQ/YmgE (transglycosylase-associated protein family)
MSILSWVVFGLVAGFIASKIVDKSGAGVLSDILIGIVGALVGGFAFSFIGQAGITGFNLWSLFVAVIGAIMLLGVVHALNGRHRHRPA